MDHRELERRVDTILGEFRILVPALAALLGFQLIAAMQSTYVELAPRLRAINFGGVICTVIALGFMLVPSAYHRLAPRLHEDDAFLALAQRSLTLGTLFFALSLTLSLYLQAARSFASNVASAGIAAGALLFFGVLWWFVPRRQVRELRATQRRERSGRGERGAQ